ncbi:hypothetical protein ANN_17077 [Periplaneta americana]|uniref:Uncharacterized protein n=1 Tax=Periplaneta americana TaxID=6978 RepID=A0ABQ8SRX9_PERAM|nr:hypothetical protein ANN_17077 [Periplaneta americana]
MEISQNLASVAHATTCTAAMIAIEPSSSFVPISLQRDVIDVHRSDESIPDRKKTHTLRTLSSTNGASLRSKVPQEKGLSLSDSFDRYSSFVDYLIFALLLRKTSVKTQPGNQFKRESNPTRAQVQIGSYQSFGISVCRVQLMREFETHFSSTQRSTLLPLILPSDVAGLYLDASELVCMYLSLSFISCNIVVFAALRSSDEIKEELNANSV